MKGKLWLLIVLGKLVLFNKLQMSQVAFPFTHPYAVQNVIYLDVTWPLSFGEDEGHQQRTDVKTTVLVFLHSPPMI